ncbi:TPA: Flp pilus assembly protein CpaB [Clostridium botulinum]|nr:Flp pilus assembly protein CpaB [Clostridium botulinum]
MKSKKIAMLIAQIGLVIAFTGGFYIFNQKQVKPTQVWTFSRDIPVNTQITDGDLKKVTIPAQAVTPDFALDKNKIVGKYVNTKVFEGEYAINKNFIGKNKIDPFQSIDLTKLRKISVPINYVDGLGGNIKKGDKVDLVFVGNGKKAGQSGEKDFTYAKAFLQDILVYNVTTDDGYKYSDRSEGNKKSGENGKDLATAGEGGKLATVTLAVTADQAEEITARMKAGTIRLVGRFNDSQNIDTAGYIIGEYNKVFSGQGLAESNK